MRLPCCPIPLVLWSGEEYESSKGLADEQYSNRVLEILGDDPKSVLEGLFPVSDMRATV